MKKTLYSRLKLVSTIKEHPQTESRMRQAVLLLLFVILLFSSKDVQAASRSQAGSPSAELIISTPDSVSPAGELNTHESAQASLVLANFPQADFAKLTFSCQYDPSLVDISNFSSSGFFSSSEIIQRFGPEDGTFEINILPGIHPWQASGSVIQFGVTGLTARELSFNCQLVTAYPDGSAVSTPFSTRPLKIVNVNRAGSVIGTVSAISPVTVTLFSGESVTTSQVTSADGSFELSAPAGDYTILAGAPGCLSLSGNLSLADGTVTSLSEASLPAGDVNADGVIDLNDVGLLAEYYNSTRITPGVTPDLNHDGIVNVLDLEIIARNFGQTSQTSWK